MKKPSFTLLSVIVGASILAACSENKTKETTAATDTTVAQTTAYGGYENNIKWGEHLVLISGCSDCHTPKKMSPQGPVDNDSLALSGHPAMMPPLTVDVKMIQHNNLGATLDNTEWIGPWGISYSANLTPDSTGIGNWTEARFITCLHTGKWMGNPSARGILPPMPVDAYSHFTDGELKAIFAYLKSVKPIHNVVPQAEPPVTH